MLNGNQLEIVQEAKYLGIILQSDLKFDKHIQSKQLKARRQLGMIKRALFDAPEQAKLLAYVSLCRPHVEYASTVWDPDLEYLKQELEMLQHKAARFICNLRGRQSITEALKKLELSTLYDRRKASRHNLLMRLLSKEEIHSSLIDTYEELMSEQSKDIPITRAATRGDPPTIYAKSKTYYNSFLPKTVRELKSKLQINH